MGVAAQTQALHRSQRAHVLVYPCARRHALVQKRREEPTSDTRRDVGAPFQEVLDQFGILSLKLRRRAKKLSVPAADRAATHVAVEIAPFGDPVVLFI